MKTRFKLDKRVVLTITVLLTATWLPLTTIAQDFQKPGDYSHGTLTWVQSDSPDIRNCQHSHSHATHSLGSNKIFHEEIVGFAESDPSQQQFWDDLDIPRTLTGRVREEPVGFADTDPANQQNLVDISAVQTSDDSGRQAYVGFSETDPVISLNQSGENIHNRIFVDCSGEARKSTVHRIRQFSSMTVEGANHDYS